MPNKQEKYEQNREILYKKYLSFGIPRRELERIYNSIEIERTSLDFSLTFEREADLYVLEQFKNNIINLTQIKEKYNYVKVLVLNVSKYDLSPEKMNEIYIRAIKLLKERYNKNDAMSYNIVSNIKYILANSLDFYDISFMGEYLGIKKEDISNLADEIDVKEDELSKYVSGFKKAPSDVVDSLCIVYNVDNYDGLQTYIKKSIHEMKLERLTTKAKILKENDKNESKKYRITFLKKYMAVYNINKNDMVAYLDTNAYVFDKMLDGVYYIDQRRLNLLCKYFNVENFEELKTKVTEETNKMLNKETKKEEKKEEIKKEPIKKESIKKEPIQSKKIITENEKVNRMIQEKNKLAHHTKEIKTTEDKRDMSFMREYVDVYNVNNKKLMELWQCGKDVVEKILNGDVRIKESLLWETYSEFKVKSYDELVNKVDELVNTKKNYERMQYEKHLEKEKRKTEIRTVNVEVDKIEKDKLFNLLNIKSMNYKECFITILLFGGMSNKNIEELSHIFNLDYGEVVRVYKNDLEMLKRVYKRPNTVVNLILENKEK